MQHAPKSSSSSSGTSLLTLLRRSSYFIIVIPLVLTLFGCRIDATSIDDASFVVSVRDTIKHDDTQWPTLETTLSSPFGPRLKASENNRYDFHRGIDIPADRGAPVFAIAVGEIFRTYFEGDPANPYPGGGNVVILRHTPSIPIPFHGKDNTRYYSLYLHLETILVNTAVPGGPYEQAEKGALIGTVGQSGETTFNHLHFEIRVGTTCSREYQLSNPEAACANYFDTPQDPHINPLLLLDYPDNDSYEVEIEGYNPLKICFKSDRDELDFNEIRVEYYQREKLVNFNDRTGISPTNIDDASYDGVTISPSRFNAGSDLYVITFEFADFPSFNSIEIKDIFGNEVKIISSKLRERDRFQKTPTQ